MTAVDATVLYPLTEQLFGRWLVSPVTSPFVIVLNEKMWSTESQFVGKWMLTLESEQQWIDIARAVCVHGISHEAKVAQRPWRDETGLVVCIYARDDDREALLQRIRDIDSCRDAKLEWKFDAATRRGLYGPGSVSYIADPGATQSYMNPEVEALAFP